MTSEVEISPPDDVGKFEVIGEIISDDSTPTFKKFNFKAYADKYLSPLTMIAVKIGKNEFLLGRIIGSHEHNPYHTPQKVALHHSMDMITEHPDENFSFTIYRLYEVEVVDQVTIDGDKYTVHTPDSLPKAGTQVIIPEPKMITESLGIKENQTEGLHLGTLATSLSSQSKIPVFLNRDIIQRHVFIGGTTGGGKSYCAKVLAEEIHKHNIPIIFFDTKNEFGQLAEKLGGSVLRPGTHYFVKLSSLHEEEVIGMIPSMTNQTHISLFTSAFITCKENHPEQFGIDELLAQIPITVRDHGASKVDETTRLIVQRANHYLSNYNFLGNNFDWTEVLYKGNVINIDCTHVSKTRMQTILAATLRELQTLRTLPEPKIPPFTIFVDEAHFFVPDDEKSISKQIIREIVRAGRHDGIAAVLITQSPIDIDKKAIRQCNTRFLFAIEPDQLQALQGVKSDTSHDLLERLPKSPQGTCILSGTYETVKHAIPIQIREMDNSDADAGQSPDIFSEVDSFPPPEEN